MCFPAAGGGVGALQAMGAALPDEFAVCIIEGPGHTLTKGPNMQSVSELADAYGCAIPSDPRECVVIGHSFGSLIAFELARRWEEAGAPCAGAIFAACRPPWTDPRRFSEFSDDQLVEWSLSIQGKTSPTPSERRAAAFVVSGFRADLVAFEAFQPARLDATPTLAVVGESDPWCTLPLAREWQTYVADLELTTVVGGHFFPLEEPDVFARVVVEFSKRRAGGRRHGLSATKAP